jgi:hypothetical protein
MSWGVAHHHDPTLANFEKTQLTEPQFDSYVTALLKLDMSL